MRVLLSRSFSHRWTPLPCACKRCARLCAPTWSSGRRWPRRSPLNSSASRHSRPAHRFPCLRRTRFRFRFRLCPHRCRTRYDRFKSAITRTDDVITNIQGKSSSCDHTRLRRNPLRPLSLISDRRLPRIRLRPSSNLHRLHRRRRRQRIEWLHRSKPRARRPFSSSSEQSASTHTSRIRRGRRRNRPQWSATPLCFRLCSSADFIRASKVHVKDWHSIVLKCPIAVCDRDELKFRECIWFVCIGSLFKCLERQNDDRGMLSTTAASLAKI